MMLKKILIIVSIICSLVFLSNTIKIGINEIKNIDYYEKIDASDLDEIFDTKKIVYVYFYKNDCVPCSSFKNTLNKVINEKNYLIYAINVKSNQDKDIQIIEKYDVKYTPTVIVFHNGKEQDRVEGNVPEEKFITFLEEEN